MPTDKDANKVNLLRNYLAQNGLTGFDSPISYDQGVELQRLQTLLQAPEQFMKAVLEWEAEQKKKEEDERKQFLDQLEAERNERYYSQRTAERIALAKGKQAQKSNLELAVIKQNYERIEEQRRKQQIAALKRRIEQEEQEEKEKRIWRVRFQEQYRDPEILEWPGQRSNRVPPKNIPVEVKPPEPKQPDIPMAPDTRKRRIKLRD